MRVEICFHLLSTPELTPSHLHNFLQLTAYHESGHAVVAIHTVGAQPIHKATITPRGNALGMVTQLPDKDEDSISMRQMLARLDVCMGGRVAEEMIFGPDQVRPSFVMLASCCCTSRSRRTLLQSVRCPSALAKGTGFGLNG